MKVLDEVIKEVSDKTGIPEKVCSEAYRSLWRFVKVKVENLDLNREYTKEEYSKIRTGFNVPHLGKLVCPYKRHGHILERMELIKKYKEKKDTINK